MDFLDEKIIEARRKEAEKELDIRKDGLIVKGEKIEFQDILHQLLHFAELSDAGSPCLSGRCLG